MRNCNQNQSLSGLSVYYKAIANCTWFLALKSSEKE